MAVNTAIGSNPLAAPPEKTDRHGSDKSKLFLCLFLQNQRRLYAYLLTLLRCRSDADDLLQETSLTMWDKFDAAAPPDEFLAWARRIAYNKVLDFYKKSQRTQSRLNRIFLERIGALAGQESSNQHSEDRREALAGCLGKLAESDRNLLARRFADGATTQSTADQVGRSVDAVYKSLAKLRQRLFECIQKTLAREGRS